MAIQINNIGFDKAYLDTLNGASLIAVHDRDCNFEVGLSYDHINKKFEQWDSWFFDEAGCREAAEFFTKLADELARRK